MLFTPRKDSPGALGGRRFDRPPSPRRALRLARAGIAPAEGPRRAPKPEAQSGLHGGKGEGKIDPSRRLSGGCGTHVGGRDDRHGPRGFVGGGDWLGGAAGGGLFPGSASCNSIGRDNSGSRYKTPCGREQSDKRGGERRWSRPSALVSQGNTGQPAPIMPGWLLVVGAPLIGAANEKNPGC